MNDLPYTKSILETLLKKIEKIERPLPTVPTETTSIYQSGFQECKNIIINLVKNYE